MVSTGTSVMLVFMAEGGKRKTPGARFGSPDQGCVVLSAWFLKVWTWIS